MGYRIRFEGLQNLVNRADHILRGEKAALGKALGTAAALVETEAKQTIYEARPTRAEKRKGAQEPPHVHLWKRTGHLRASLTHYVEASGLRAYVGSNLPYAPVHEYGATIQRGARTQAEGLVGRKVGRGKKRELRIHTRRAHGVGAYTITIPPRPYLGPALEAKRDAVREELEKVLSDLLAGN